MTTSDKKELNRFPVLESAYIYDDCEVKDIYNFDKNPVEYGFMTFNGKFIRLNENDEYYENGDRTVASLMSGIYKSLNASFNRFFEYKSDTSEIAICPHQHFGFDFWLKDNEIDFLGRDKAPRKKLSI